MLQISHEIYVTMCNLNNKNNSIFLFSILNFSFFIE